MTRAVRHFVRRLSIKVHRDDALFMAAGLAWGVLFAIIPLVTFGIGLTGFVLSARFADPTDAVLALFAGVLPQAGAEMDLTGLLNSVVTDVMTNRAGFTLLGLVIFVWLASSLSSHLRGSLSKVFDVGAKRNFLHGLGFDLVAVVVGVVFITLNLGVTVLLTAVVEFGVDVFGWGPRTLSFADRLVGIGIAVGSIWTLYLIAYRFFPARPIRWRTAVLAASFAALAHEGLKQAFSWYVTNVADYQSTLGNLATIAALLLWIYWGALVFILGGEVAYVYYARETSVEGAVE